MLHEVFKLSFSVATFPPCEWLADSLCIPSTNNRAGQAEEAGVLTFLIVCHCTYDPGLFPHLFEVKMTGALNQNFLIMPHYPSEMLYLQKPIASPSKYCNYHK